MKKKIILSAGGTGGHLFPAQAVARELLDDYELLFVGSGLSQNRFFDQNAFPYCEINAATLSLKKPFNILRIGQGVLQSCEAIRRFRPHAIIGFGSFYTFPVLSAGAMMQIPLFLHEQNALPGKVTRLFSRFARCTAISFPQAASLLKGKTIEVDFPHSHTFSEEKRERAAAYFQLHPVLPVILIFGGSQGAQQMNARFQEAVPLLSFPFQILHLTGTEPSAQEARACYARLGIRHCVKAFEPQMDLAWSLASLAVTRAGASTVMERIAAEVPGVLIPFPRASEDHQRFNAEHFVDTIKGGTLLLERELTASLLAKQIENLWSTLREKKENIKSYKIGYKEKKFSDIIRELL